RNANAGVINVATAKPQFDLSSASLDLTAGNYNLFRAKGHVNASPHSTLAIRAAAYVERRDGFTEFQEGSKVAPGSALYSNSDKTAFRLGARWKPSDNFEVFVSGEQFIDQGAGTVPVRLTPKPGTELRSALIDSPGVLDLMNTSLRGRIDYRPWESIQISYLGGYGRMTRKNVNDNDLGFDEANRFQQEHRTASSRFLSQSHEIQFTFDNQWVDVLVGGFFYEENNKIRFDIDINDDPNGDLIPDTYWAMTFIQPKRILNSYAVFSQMTGKFTDWLRATGGIRYSSDTKSDEGGLNLVCPGFGSQFGSGGVNLKDLDFSGIPISSNPFRSGEDIPGERLPYDPGTCGSFPGNNGNDVEKTWDEITWMARLEFEPLDNWLAYALVNTGFKSGVIQDGGDTANPEYVTNFEIGNRLGFLDNRLNISLTGFYSDYSDIIRARAEEDENGAQQLVSRNISSARIFGVEAEVTWVASESDRLQLATSYLNAKYDDYPDFIDTGLYTNGNLQAPRLNLEGNFLPFSPEFSLTAVYEHTFAFDFGYIIPRIQTQIQTAMFLGDLNRDVERQDAYTRTNLSIRYETDGGWLAEFFALNIEDLVSDNDIINNVDFRGNQPSATATPGTLGTVYGYLDAPGTYGFRVGYRWSE
ncbi:MAG: TonB-dependent receptor, partial [Myxococcales bacterium]|nr:TonB-dependent receptor [Myxococcales bacterium]